MLYNLIAAVALVLILEGILPFAAPQWWRKMVILMGTQNNRTLRITGLISMLIGVIILVLAHRYF